ncbi:hypothetical protein [Caenibius sp. WL]|uniref:hypothetical protein n=1 Tax=Caenibius sp. WL TaxID=2872646 RepID=UPI001C9A0354|nr:hypothetical protein [Caenibius sp. WL]QZP07968.1 hypothetical protein K5X80_15190 [Caenibius sp. WL]
MPDLISQSQPEGRGEPEALPVPLGGTRAQAIFRLQIGIAGLVAILMMIGLANIVMDRAKQTEATTVPEAASTLAPVKIPPVPASDPLADAGVIPSSKGDDTSAKTDGNGPPNP